MPLGLTIGFALAGLLLGVGADRVATHWPEHGEEHRPGRPVDWRTVATGAIGAVGLGVLPQRFATDPLALGFFTLWVATLVVALATDLDQRLLPDALTIPVIPVALLYAASGLNPLVGRELGPALVASVAIPAVLYLPSLSFGAGAFGLGDVKLLVGTGLALGLTRAMTGVLSGLVVAGVVLAVLLAAGRVGRRSHVPFGPFLILGALWGLVC